MTDTTAPDAITQAANMYAGDVRSAGGNYTYSDVRRAFEEGARHRRLAAHGAGEGLREALERLERRPVHDGYDDRGDYVWVDYIRWEDVRDLLATTSSPDASPDSGEGDRAALLMEAFNNPESVKIGEGEYDYAKIEQLPRMLRDAAADTLFCACEPHVTIDAWNIARMAADELEARLAASPASLSGGAEELIENAARALYLAYAQHPEARWDAVDPAMQEGVWRAHIRAIQAGTIRVAPSPEAPANRQEAGEVIGQLLAMVPDDERGNEWETIRDNWRAAAGEAAMDGWRWWWRDHDDESYSGCCATRDDALTEARREASEQSVELIEARVWADDLDAGNDYQPFADTRNHETVALTSPKDVKGGGR